MLSIEDCLPYGECGVDVGGHTHVLAPGALLMQLSCDLMANSQSDSDAEIKIN